MKSCRDKRTCLRMQYVLWTAQGVAATTIAELTGSCLKSIYNHVHCYLNTHQANSLTDTWRSGRPLTAACITDKRIQVALQQNPLQSGYHTNIWAKSLLVHYLNNKYKCVISESTLRRRMKAMGLRFKRPRYVCAEKDPEKAKKRGYGPKAKANGGLRCIAL
jgi:transposase